MTSTRQARPLLSPRPQAVAWLGRSLCLSAGDRLEAGSRCRTHPVVRSLIRDELAGRLGLAAGRSPSGIRRCGAWIRLEVFPLSAADRRACGLDGGDIEALQHPSGQGYVLKVEPAQGRVVLVGAGIAGCSTR